MARKGTNTRVEAANNRKASSKAEKERQKESDREAKETEKWSQGAKKKGKKDLDIEKKTAQLQKKQELAKILAEEEKSLAKTKPAKAQVKKALFTTERTRPSTSAKIDRPESSGNESQKKIKPILSDKDIEKHPERRFKNALKEFEERELKNYRAQYSGLRLSQLKEIIYKDFQKSPYNPFNQTNVVSYNTSLEEARRQIDGEPEPSEEEEGEQEEENKELESIQSPNLDVNPSAKAVSSY